jgi:hypothetical protein
LYTFIIEWIDLKDSCGMARDAVNEAIGTILSAEVVGLTDE